MRRDVEAVQLAREAVSRLSNKTSEIDRHFVEAVAAESNRDPEPQRRIIGPSSTCTLTIPTFSASSLRFTIAGERTTKRSGRICKPWIWPAVEFDLTSSSVGFMCG